MTIVVFSALGDIEEKAFCVSILDIAGLVRRRCSIVVLVDFKSSGDGLFLAWTSLRKMQTSQIGRKRRQYNFLIAADYTVVVTRLGERERPNAEQRESIKT